MHVYLCFGQYVNDTSVQGTELFLRWLDFASHDLQYDIHDSQMKVSDSKCVVYYNFTHDKSTGTASFFRI